ncbi:MAG TPA: hypothetical protein DD460_10720, partial [Acidobacteria bacterium]|nr:hypothetical protein [Acidobacteriota bacterium]
SRIGRGSNFWQITNCLVRTIIHGTFSPPTSAVRTTDLDTFYAFLDVDTDLVHYPLGLADFV